MITDPHSIEDIKRAFTYDPDTGQIFWRRVDGDPHLPGREAGYHTKWGHMTITYDNKHYSAHHIAWALYYCCWPVGKVKHLNGDKTDNRVSNLTLANKRNWSRSTLPQQPPWE